MNTISNNLNLVLAMLEPALSSSSKSNFYYQIAIRLSRIARKKAPWSWRYIQGVSAGTIRPSKRFSVACNLLAETLNGTQPELVGLVPVQIYAQPNLIQPNSIITFPSYICAYPSCTRTFIPRVPSQKFCPQHKRNPKGVSCGGRHA